MRTGQNQVNKSRQGNTCIPLLGFIDLVSEAIEKTEGFLRFCPYVFQNLKTKTGDTLNPFTKVLIHLGIKATDKILDFFGPARVP